MPKDRNAFAVETLETRTLMTGAPITCAHAAAAMEPGAQGYRIARMEAASFGNEISDVRVSVGHSPAMPPLNRVELALLRAAAALANQVRESDSASGGNHAQPPTREPVSELSAPTPQSLAQSTQRISAELVAAPHQIATEAASLASSATRQEVLSTDFSSKVSAAASFVSSAPALFASPIFSSAYSASITTWDTIQSSVAAIAPQVVDIVSSPAVASSIAAVVVPAERIFNFAEMGSPLVFLGDAISNFAEESASVPAVLASAPTSETAWLITGLVAAVDVAVLVCYYRARANRRNAWSTENDPFSRQLVSELDSIEDLG